mmetsp:Transcript_8637/g.14864  ORF Transcript_8637/g.14864 Transcript_8637/m.14864 type:complete len:174 (-) Transcript_8637:1167-1688(-)
MQSNRRLALLAAPQHTPPDDVGGPDGIPASASTVGENTPSSTPPSTADLSPDSAPAKISWPVASVFQTLAVFIFAGLLEISGGWFVWQCVREKKAWWYFPIGAVLLVAYGVVPTLQPEGSSFSRVYAVYGGVFVVLSYGWGWVVDGDKPDTGDFVGGSIALAGVAIAWFWPRG